MEDPVSRRMIIYDLNLKRERECFAFLSGAFQTHCDELRQALEDGHIAEAVSLLDVMEAKAKACVKDERRRHGLFHQSCVMAEEKMTTLRMLRTIDDFLYRRRKRLGTIYKEIKAGGEYYAGEGGDWKRSCPIPMPLESLRDSPGLLEVFNSSGIVVSRGDDLVDLLQPYRVRAMCEGRLQDCVNIAGGFLMLEKHIMILFDMMCMYTEELKLPHDGGVVDMSAINIVEFLLLALWPKLTAYTLELGNKGGRLIGFHVRRFHAATGLLQLLWPIARNQVSCGFRDHYPPLNFGLFAVKNNSNSYRSGLFFQIVKRFIYTKETVMLMNSNIPADYIMMYYFHERNNLFQRGEDGIIDDLIKPDPPPGDSAPDPPPGDSAPDDSDAEGEPRGEGLEGGRKRAGKRRTTRERNTKRKRGVQVAEADRPTTIKPARKRKSLAESDEVQHAGPSVEDIKRLEAQLEARRETREKLNRREKQVEQLLVTITGLIEAGLLGSSANSMSDLGLSAA